MTVLFILLGEGEVIWDVGKRGPWRDKFSDGEGEEWNMYFMT